MSEQSKARAEADAARADLLAIGQELQRRLAPRTIISESVDTLRERAEDAADTARKAIGDGLEIARERAGDAAVTARRVAREKPGVVVGIAAVAAGLVAWQPLRRLAARRSDRRPDVITTR